MPQLASAVKQVSVEASAVEKAASVSVAHSSPNKSRGDSCTQTVGRSGTSAMTSKGSSKKSRKVVADHNGGSGKSVTPKKLETAVVTAMQMSVANQYHGDQERELDLSQKSTVVSPATSSPTTEMIKAGPGCRVPSARPPVKNVEESSVDGSKVSGPAMSQITNLERFVSGMDVNKVQSFSGAESSSSVKPPQSHPAKRPSKRKLDMSGDGHIPSNSDPISMCKKAKLASEIVEVSQENAASPQQVQAVSIPFKQQVIGSPVSISPELNTSLNKHADVVLKNQSADPMATASFFATVLADSQQSADLSQQMLSTVKTDCSVLEVCKELASVPNQNALISVIEDLSTGGKINGASSDGFVSECASSAVGSLTVANTDVEKSKLIKQANVDETASVGSPGNQEMVAILKTKSSGSESGKKRRKDPIGSAVKDRKTPVGIVGELMGDEKLAKPRNAEDLTRKIDKKDMGQWEWYGTGEMKLVHSKVRFLDIIKTRLRKLTINHSINH